MTTKRITFRTFKEYCMCANRMDYITRHLWGEKPNRMKCVRFPNDGELCKERNCPIWKHLRTARNAEEDKG